MSDVQVSVAQRKPPVRNPHARILIVEDMLSLAMLYQHQLQKAGLESDIHQTGQEALSALQTGQYEVMLLDLQLPDMDGYQLLDQLKEMDIQITTIMITAHGSVNTAVTAMRHGAYDFIMKPVAAERLVTTLKNALERSELHTTVKTLAPARDQQGFFGFIGSSLQMQSVYKMIESVSQSQAAVFVTGESGTGKEICAHAIHKAGPRRKGPFIAINCAAIPKDLIESEMFGHRKGAFTGANSDRNGAALSADGGTLFLDEICEMDINLQSKLLRFLQTGQVQRVGEDKLHQVNVRVVCATNRHPMTEVAAGRFREDLYYRLHVLAIPLPPLRERGADVIDIAEFFLTKAAEEEQKNFNGFDASAQEWLLAHSWPGNVRELENLIRNIVVMHEGPVVTAQMFPTSIGGFSSGFAVSGPAISGPAMIPPVSPNQGGIGSGFSGDNMAHMPPVYMPDRRKGADNLVPLSGSSRDPYGHHNVGAMPDQQIQTGNQQIDNQSTLTLDINRPFQAIERDIIEAVIKNCEGSLPKAAKMLNVSPSTLYRKRESWEVQDEVATEYA